MSSAATAAALLQAHKLQELVKQLTSAGLELPSLDGITLCLDSYGEQLSVALPSCKTQQDLWLVFPRAFPATLHAVWQRLQAWVCSEQPLPVVTEAASSILRCLHSSQDVFACLAKAHWARKPPEGDAAGTLAAGKQHETPLDVVLRKGSLGLFYMTLATLCLRLHGIPAADTDCPPICGHALAALDCWELTEGALQASTSMSLCLKDCNYLGPITSVQHCQALLHIIDIAWQYSQYCWRVVSAATDGNNFGKCELFVGRLGPQGQVVCMTQGWNETLHAVFTSTLDILVVKAHVELKPAELRRPDGAKLGVIAAAHLEARIMASVVRALQLLCLSHLTWQATPSWQPVALHISFLRADLECLWLLCKRHPWPRHGTQGWDSRRAQQHEQPGQQQPNSQLSADEAQSLLQVLQAVAWSVLRVALVNVQGQHAQTPQELASAHSYAARLLWFIHERHLLADAPEPRPLTLLCNALVNEYSTVSTTKYELECKASALEYLVRLMAAAAAHDIRQLQLDGSGTAQQHADGHRPPISVPSAVFHMLECVRCAVTRILRDPFSDEAIKLQLSANILTALQEATALLLLTDYAGAGAASAGRRQLLSMNASSPGSSLWTQAPDLYRATSLNLLPALALAGQHSLQQFDAEYRAARKAEANAGANSLATGQQRQEQSVRTVLDLLTAAVAAALTGIITICWPALMGSARRSAVLGSDSLHYSPGAGQELCSSTGDHYVRYADLPAPLPPAKLTAAGSSSDDNFFSSDDVCCESYAEHAVLSLGASDVTLLLKRVAEAIRKLLPVALELLHPGPTVVTVAGRATGDKKDKQEQEKREAEWRELQLVNQATAALSVIRLVQLAAQCTEVLVKLGSEAILAVTSGLQPNEDDDSELMAMINEQFESLALSSRWMYFAMADSGILDLLSEEAVVSLLHFPWRQPELHPTDWQRHWSLQPLLQQLGQTAAPELLPKVLSSITHSVCRSAYVITDAALLQLQQPVAVEQLQRQRRQSEEQPECGTQATAAVAAARPGTCHRIPVLVITEDSDDDTDRSETGTRLLPGLSTGLQQGGEMEANDRQPLDDLSVAVHRTLCQAVQLTERLVPACAELAAQHCLMVRPRQQQQREAGAAAGRGADGEASEAAAERVLLTRARAEACALLASQAQRAGRLAVRAAGAAWRAVALVCSVIPVESAGSSEVGDDSDGSCYGAAEEVAELAWSTCQAQLCDRDWGVLAGETYAGKFRGRCSSRSCPFVAASAGTKQAMCPRCKIHFCCRACVHEALEARQHVCASLMSPAELAQVLDYYRAESSGTTTDASSDSGSSAALGLGTSRGPRVPASPSAGSCTGNAGAGAAELAASFESEEGDAGGWAGTGDDLPPLDCALRDNEDYARLLAQAEGLGPEQLSEMRLALSQKIKQMLEPFQSASRTR